MSRAAPPAGGERRVPLSHTKVSAGRTGRLLSNDRGFATPAFGVVLNVSPGNPVANELHAPSNMLCTTLANAMGVPLTDFGTAATGKPGELSELKR